MWLQKIFLSCFLFNIVFIVSGQEQTAPIPVSKNGFIVISHRGSHLIKPENTIAAFEDAITEGADYVEMDLRTTKDGYLSCSFGDLIRNSKEEFIQRNFWSVIQFQRDSGGKVTGLRFDNLKGVKVE